MSKNYYDILGITKSASKDEIKKAFRKIAQKEHPDKGGNEARFKEASEAYAILSDDKKRAEYDAYGQTFAGGGAGPAGGAGFGGFDGFDFSDFARAAQGQGGVEFDLGDIFGDFFGGGRGRSRRGRDISIDLQIDFKESVLGTERTVLLNKFSTCATCKGNGAASDSDLVTCTTCNGQGKVRDTKRSILGTFSTVQACETCHATGKVPKNKCKTCHGEGVVKQEEEVNVAIPGGINNGEMIRMSGFGEAVPGGEAGDLYIKVHVKPHPTLRKEGNNLISELSVKLSDALLGATYNVDTIDGALDVKIPAGISHGELLRVRNKGVMTGTGNRGDLLIRITIPLPQKLSKKAKKLIEDLKEEGI